TLPEPSCNSTLCGVPASSLTNAIVNGLPAGAVTLDSTNLIPWAWIVTSPVAGGGAPLPDGPPLPAGGALAGAPGLADAPADPLAPAAEPIAKPLDWRTAAMRTMTVSTLSSAVGVRGAGPFSRCPVVSATTVRRYSWTAAVSQPTSVA